MSVAVDNVSHESGSTRDVSLSHHSCIQVLVVQHNPSIILGNIP
jgi:hypothetical protein